MMKSIRKRGWIIFVGSCIFTSLLGLFFLLFEKKIFIPSFINDSGQNIVVNGWPIVVIGIVSLLFGLLIKWSAGNDKDNGIGISDPPRTEFVNQKAK